MRVAAIVFGLTALVLAQDEALESPPEMRQGMEERRPVMRPSSAQEKQAASYVSTFARADGTFVAYVPANGAFDLVLNGTVLPDRGALQDETAKEQFFFGGRLTGITAGSTGLTLQVTKSAAKLLRLSRIPSQGRRGPFKLGSFFCASP